MTSVKCYNALNTFLGRYIKKYDDIDILMNKISKQKELDLQDNSSKDDGSVKFIKKDDELRSESRQSQSP